jgi:murein DD-endopeptidase MepM/ murein hydrolase activator NlpD
VQFTRISSHFNPHRRHPILHTIRAHRGVDYAAPQGTPIKASGNGKVKFVGRQNGYGNTIILDHSLTYSTLYAHLSHFASRLRPGQHVRQGQIVGYVGRTGSATGPHLHYEFRVNGVHKNPLTVKLPNALPLEGQHLAQFKAETRGLLSKLDALAVSHAGPSQGLASTAEGARVTLAAQTTARIRP